VVRCEKIKQKLNNRRVQLREIDYDSAIFSRIDAVFDRATHTFDVKPRTLLFVPSVQARKSSVDLIRSPQKIANSLVNH
jgi:hypothetical protein